MIHIGEPAFYDRVYKDALAHDVVLVEGLNSPITERVTRSYRWVASSKRLQLIVQPQRKKLEGSRTRVIHADLSHNEFVVHWREVRLWMRLVIYIAAPLYGLKLRWTATRASLAKRLPLDDLRSRDEALQWSPESGLLDRAIMDMRDRRLIEKLDEALANTDLRRVAVVYGARHMRAVLKHLVGTTGFQVDDMEWMVVFSL